MRILEVLLETWHGIDQGHSGAGEVDVSGDDNDDSSLLHC